MIVVTSLLTMQLHGFWLVVCHLVTWLHWWVVAKWLWIDMPHGRNQSHI